MKKDTANQLIASLRVGGEFPHQFFIRRDSLPMQVKAQTPQPIAHSLLVSSNKIIGTGFKLEDPQSREKLISNVNFLVLTWFLEEGI